MTDDLKAIADAALERIDRLMPKKQWVARGNLPPIYMIGYADGLEFAKTLARMEADYLKAHPGSKRWFE